MIPDFFIYFVVFTLLIWVFGNKIIPQLAVMAGVLWASVTYISTMALDTTIADTNTAFLLLIFPVLLYVVNIAHITGSLLIPPEKEEKPKGAK